MRPIKVDDATKQVTVKFGGAISGNYNVYIRHSQFGLIDTSALTLNVESDVNSISPMSGSIHGGTLVTIQGANWGDELTDNPVEISYLGAVGSTKCYVKETSATQIKCRVDSAMNPRSDGESGKMLVFLKTYEEANCTLSNDCKFTFTSTLPTVTAVSTVWDAVDYKWNLKVMGTAITGDIASTELSIQGVNQVVKSVSSSEAIFVITDSQSMTLSNMAVYFDIGVPNGRDKMYNSQTLEPKFVSITPNSGSAGGTWIVANVQGVGPQTSGLDLVDSTDASICEKLEVPSYGVVRCLTKANHEVTAANQLKVTQNGLNFDCIHSDTTNCQYEQLLANGPIVTAVTLSTDTDIVFDGTSFPDASTHDAFVQFAGLNASSVSVGSATNLVGTFDMGVPVSALATPSVWFKEKSTGLVTYA